MTVCGIGFVALSSPFRFSPHEELAAEAAPTRALRTTAARCTLSFPIPALAAKLAASAAPTRAGPANGPLQTARCGTLVVQPDRSPPMRTVLAACALTAALAACNFTASAPPAESEAAKTAEAAPPAQAET